MKVLGRSLLLSGLAQPHIADALLSLSRSEASALAGSTGSNPLQKVVTLLTDMQKEVEKEKNADAALSAEFQCWCTKTIKEKKSAIAEAEDSIKMTTELIESLTAKKAELQTQIKKLTKDLKDQEEDLAATEANREKEGEAFRKFELDTTKAIRQLTGAITILSKHQGFLQKDDISQVRKILQSTGEDFPELVPDSSVQSAVSLLQAMPYASQSGEIFGILTQMKEQMQADLKDRTAKEAGSLAAFEKLRKSKRESIVSTRTSLSKAKENLGLTSQELERAKKSIKETSDQLAADKKFLADVETRSAADKKELASRAKMQAQELTALDDTLKILTSDEARAMFRKTPHTSFVQIQASQTMRSRRARAAEVLRATNKPQLVLMASKVQLAAFEKVKAAIQQLIEELKEEKAEEIKKRDYCTEAFNTNEAAIFDATTKEEDLSAAKAQLEKDIEGLVAVLKETREKIAELKVDIATATYNRQQEVAAYKVVFGDNSLVKGILVKALERLRDFYNKEALLQQPQIMPTGLNKGGYKKSGSGGGAIGMLENHRRWRRGHGRGS
jgi:chromosome segregation ATPase